MPKMPLKEVLILLNRYFFKREKVRKSNYLSNVIFWYLLLIFKFSKDIIDLTMLEKREYKTIVMFFPMGAFLFPIKPSMLQAQNIRIDSQYILNIIRQAILYTNPGVPNLLLKWMMNRLNDIR